MLVRVFLVLTLRAAGSGTVVLVQDRVLVTATVTAADTRRELQDVAIWLTPPDAEVQRAAADATPKTRVRMIQKEKRFDPRVVLVGVGSVVEFPNADPFFH